MLTEAINKRVSVRTYQKRPLTEKDQQAIRDVIAELKFNKGPFTNSVRFVFYDSPFAGDNGSIQIGTYGFIKNPPAFIAGTILNSFQGLIDYGYLMEMLILKLTHLGFGTVWLGGTFNRSAFNHILGENEIVPAITPVGYIKEQRSLREKMIRSVAKGDLRKPFEALFFNHDLSHPIHVDHPLSKYLDLIRIGPSGSNKQPWRLLIDQKVVHFYLKRTEGYGTGLPYDIQALDMGIAICHFEIGLRDSKVNYKRYIDSSVTQFRDMQYIISFDLL
jgi:nitroreductase